MHKVMAGVRVVNQHEPDFFGWDEVNEFIRHGMRVLAVEPGVFYEGDLDNAGSKITVWYVTVLLSDVGIDSN